MAYEMQKTDSAPPIPFSAVIKSKISSVLAGKKGDEFVTAMINLTNINPALRLCNSDSLVAAGLQAQSLDLSLHPAMGQAYIVPFKDNKNSRSLATFQIGYKGYLQLAMRSGQYIDITVSEIKEGEFISYSPITEKFVFNDLAPDTDRDALPAIGYYCGFEYANGFKKSLYWPLAKMRAHALKYSFAYANDLKYNKQASFWSKDFDAMAKKTMLRQLLTKWGIMSVENISMQAALIRDGQAAISTGEWGGYPDNETALDDDPIDDTSEDQALDTLLGLMNLADDTSRELAVSFIQQSANARKMTVEAMAKVGIDNIKQFTATFEKWYAKQDAPKTKAEPKAETAQSAPESSAPSTDDQPAVSQKTREAIDKELTRIGGTGGYLPPELASAFGTGDPSELSEAQGREAIKFLKGIK